MVLSSAIPYDRRRSQTLLRSAICDPRSYGNQPLDSTWFYLLRSSAITIADLIAICDHMETSLYRVFSHDVTAAMLVSQNKEMAAMLVSQTKPLGIELYFYANTFFCFIKPI